MDEQREEAENYFEHERAMNYCKQKGYSFKEITDVVNGLELKSILIATHNQFEAKKAERDIKHFEDFLLFGRWYGDDHAELVSRTGEIAFTGKMELLDEEYAKEIGNYTYDDDTDSYWYFRLD